MLCIAGYKNNTSKLLCMRLTFKSIPKIHAAIQRAVIWQRWSPGSQPGRGRTEMGFTFPHEKSWDTFPRLLCLLCETKICATSLKKPVNNSAHWTGQGYKRVHLKRVSRKTGEKGGRGISQQQQHRRLMLCKDLGGDTSMQSHKSWCLLNKCLFTSCRTSLIARELDKMWETLTLYDSLSPLWPLNVTLECVFICCLPSPHQ